MVDVKDLAAAANAMGIYKEKLEVKAGGLSLLVKQVHIDDVHMEISLNRYIYTPIYIYIYVMPIYIYIMYMRYEHL
jgi:hypothetical protein